MAQSQRAPLSPQKVLRPIEDERNGAFFVRGRTRDKSTGDEYWVLSPLAESDRNQEYRVKVPKDQSMNSSAIINALEGHVRDVISKVVLVKRLGDPDWEVREASPAPSERDRIIERDYSDEKGHKRRMRAFTWTEELDNEVERMHEYDFFQKGATHLREMINSPSGDGLRLFHESHFEMFRKEMERLALAYGSKEKNPFTFDEIEAFANKLYASGGGLSSISNALACRETYLGGVEGGAGRYYSTDIPFERGLPDGMDIRQTFSDPARKEQAMAMLANYCAQKAVGNMIKTALVRPVIIDGVSMTPTEAKELQMVKDELLFATNPLMDPEKRFGETQEIAELASSKLIRGCAMATGAVPQRPEFDDVAIGETVVDQQTGLHVPSSLVGQSVAAAHFQMEKNGLSLDGSERSVHGALDAMLGACSERAELASEVVTKGNGGIVAQQIEHGAIMAPFTLKKPILSPKTMTRLEEFQKHAEEGVKSFAKALDDMTTNISIVS